MEREQNGTVADQSMSRIQGILEGLSANQAVRKLELEKLERRQQICVKDTIDLGKDIE